MNLKKLLPLLLLPVLAWPALRPRWAWERDAVLTLCVDGGELDFFFSGEDLPAAIHRLSAAGVRSVAVAVGENDPIPETLLLWATRLSPEMNVTLRPSFPPLSDKPRPWAAADFNALPSFVRHILPSGAAFPFPGPSSVLHQTMASSKLLFPLLEFSKARALTSLATSFPGRTLRAHSVDEEEILRMTPASAAARLRRAARERGARFLYVRMFPGLTPEENLSYVEGLAEDLRRDGFSPGDAVPRRLAAPSEGRASVPARQALALLVAALGPWLVFRAARALPGPVWTRLPALLLFSLAAGLLVAAPLSSGAFLSGLSSFRGVKIALLVPFLFVAMELWSAKEARDFLRRPLTVGNALVLGLLTVTAALFLLRSGHDGGLSVPWLEVKTRETLETLLGVRPRFKEFSLGWPLLCLAAHAESRGKDARVLWFLGLLAPISIINTFCHAHAPLDVSLLRSFHGFWLGMILSSPFFFIRFSSGIASSRR